MQTIKALGALLHYPQEELIEALDVIQQLIEAEPLLCPDQIAALGRCIDGMRDQALLDLQEQYVQVFDTNPKHALHLFQHLYGDTPQRGPALADLIEMYREYGYTPTGKELPDYLPLFSEFAAQFPLPEARALLGRALPVVNLIERRLVQAGSDYAAVFNALGSLAERNEDTAAIEQLLNAQSKNGERDASIDEAWKEQPVTFTGEDGQFNQSTGTVNIPVESMTRDRSVRNR